MGTVNPNTAVPMKRLARLLLLLLSAQASLVAAAEPVLQDDFSRNDGWSTPDSRLVVAHEAGRLSLDNRDAGLHSISATRPIPLSAAANYRLSVDITIERLGGDDAFAGVELIAPSGDAIGLQLSPKDHNLRITYWYRGHWVGSIMPWTLSKALKSEPGAVNTLTLESKNGSFVVTVNGEFVARSRVIDFSPISVGLGGGGSFAAHYDNLSITETGLDSRLARLSLRSPVPGQRLLAADDFKSYSGAAKLMSLAKKKNDRPDWDEFWNNANSRVEIDGPRQRMIMESKSDRSAFTTISSYFPLQYAGVAVSARFNFLKLAQEDDCAGVVVQGQREISGERDLMLACVSQTQSMLAYFDVSTGQWRRLTTGSLALPGTAEIVLTINGDQILMFVDGRLQISADRPTGFGYYTSGLRIDPMQSIEVLEFKASEI